MAHSACGWEAISSGSTWWVHFSFTCQSFKVFLPIKKGCCSEDKVNYGPLKMIRTKLTYGPLKTRAPESLPSMLPEWQRHPSPVKPIFHFSLLYSAVLDLIRVFLKVLSWRGCHGSTYGFGWIVLPSRESITNVKGTHLRGSSLELSMCWSFTSRVKIYKNKNI